MKMWRNYSCHAHHQWSVLADEKDPETKICPLGHEAITREVHTPVDEVQITLRPAGRFDPRTPQMIHYDRQYYLVICDLQSSEEKCSNIPLGWTEALKKAEIFLSKTKAEAWKWWDRLKL